MSFRILKNTVTNMSVDQILLILLVFLIAVQFFLLVLASPIFEFPDKYSINIKSYTIVILALIILINFLGIIGISVLCYINKNLNSFLILCVCFCIFIISFYGKEFWPYFWNIEYKINPSKYASCIADANEPTHIGFAVCRSYEQDDGAESFIVYDKSGEIINQFDHHSKEWEERISCSNFFFPNEYEAIPINNGFYRVFEIIKSRKMGFTKISCPSINNTSSDTFR